MDLAGLRSILTTTLCVERPQPGMLLQAAQAYAINLQSSFIIGDRWRDIEAGQRAGCRTIFIDYHYDERQPKNPTWRVNSITEAAALILKSERI